ncbi:hypothetical protein JCM8547_005381 [Rhodosporidiobolus lusitaniae]
MADASDAGRIATLEEAAAMVGAPECGWLVSQYLAGLYTILHFQWVMRHQKRASKTVTGVVWLVFALCSVFLGLIMTEQLHWTISNDRTARHLFLGWRFEAFTPFFLGLVPAPVQSLLTWRASSFIRNQLWRNFFRLAVAVIILFGLTSSCLMCASVLLGWDGFDPTVGPFDYTVAFACQQWANAFIDLLISFTLAISLRKRIAGFSHSTDSLLRRLARNALQTASYTAVLALCGAITASISHAVDDWRFTYVPYTFALPLPFCYSISLFTTLATRQTIEAHVSAPVMTGAPRSSPRQRGLGGPERLDLGRRGEKRSIDGLSERYARRSNKGGVWVEREEVQTIERDEEPIRSEKMGRLSQAGTDEIV